MKANALARNCEARARAIAVAAAAVAVAVVAAAAAAVAAAAQISDAHARWRSRAFARQIEPKLPSFVRRLRKDHSRRVNIKRAARWESEQGRKKNTRARP